MSYEYLKDNLHGIISLVFTPFKADGSLNEEALRYMINKMKGDLRGHRACIMAGGSLAEFFTMSDAETVRYIDVVSETVGKDIPLIMGVGRAGTDYTIELAQYAESRGAAAVMVMNPYYVAPTEAGLYRHYARIAGSVNCGIVLYNNSQQTKIALYPELTKRLSEIDNIVGIKENTPYISTYTRLMTIIDPEKFVVTCGPGYDFYPYAALAGVRGYVTELMNILPETAIALQDAAETSDYPRMMEIVYRMDPYMKVQSGCAAGALLPSLISPFVASAGFTYLTDFMKCAISISNGIEYGRARDPSELISNESIERLRQVIYELKALQWQYRP